MKATFKKYKSYGLACLPVQKDKSPFNVTGWKSGVDEESSYNSWGIGLVCGLMSGGLECIDFDNHFGDAQQRISEFIQCDEIKPLYDKHKFPIEKTMNGGYHLLYRCGSIEGNKKLARRPVWKEERRRFEPDVIIETRGEGGYFVCAPSPGYKLVRGSYADIPVISPTERKLIFEVCRSFNEWKEREITRPEEAKEKPGDIYNQKSEAIDDAIRCLKGEGWTEVTPGKWRRPDKKDGISATFGKVAPNVFYNFSSSAYPFEPETAYKPFQIVALLKHNGDFSGFAKELAEKYTDIVKDTKPEKKKNEVFSKDQLDDVLRKSYIDLEVKEVRPPVIMEIKNGFDWQRLFTLGNFSAITGKGKSKKSMLCSLFEAAAAKNGIVESKFRGILPGGKKMVLRFDTEQSRYDAWATAKRVQQLTGLDLPNYGSFDLREFEPMQRCEIIEHALIKFGTIAGLVVIDGIADLAKAINDEEEATRVGSFLMRLTKVHNIHIITVIHQNKGDNFATGHLGSMIIKKAEAVIGVERDVDDRVKSIVTNDNMRGAADFDDFCMKIEEHLPRIDHDYNPKRKIKDI